MIKYVIAALLAVFSLTASAERLVMLGTANTVNLRGEINDLSADEAAKELIRLDGIRGQRDYPIFLVVESPGGSILAGENFIEVAKTVKNLHTITIFAASMASAIVEALPGERLILDSGAMMFHRARGQISGQFETGEMESRLYFYKSMVRKMEQRNAERMKMPLKLYKQKVLNEWWLTSDEALANAAADEVVGIKCTPKLIEKKSISTLDLGFFRVQIQMSECPLLKAGEPVKETEQSAKEAYQKYLSERKVYK